MARASLAFGIMGTIVTLGMVVTLFASPSVTPPPPPALEDEAGAHLRAFRSEAELLAWLEEKKKTYRIEQSRAADFVQDAPVSAAEPAAASPVEESITNTQSAGVDEGGIVKLHGKHLVILRRGRLFT
ncbi:MAG: beta-propeller domain-containing protein, partial [Zoogloeaceae bacterium]|nr:beta-propeller domain-containing protein [Zoogloeaceae bacterium]